MGQTQRFKEASGCKVTRVTLENDVAAPNGVEFVPKALQEFCAKLTLLFASMPCAGGSPWQF
jgi:hypothetical protein